MWSVSPFVDKDKNKDKDKDRRNLEGAPRLLISVVSLTISTGSLGEWSPLLLEAQTGALYVIMG